MVQGVIWTTNPLLNLKAGGGSQPYLDFASRKRERKKKGGFVGARRRNIERMMWSIWVFLSDSEEKTADNYATAYNFW